MPKTVAVIDGNSLMHRAFHAVPNAMTAPDGTPTNAAFGFMSMLIKFIEVASPDAIVCAFDRGKPAFRMEELEGYKAQRPPMDPDLKVQFPVIEGLLEAMNIPVVALEGWEGDDILGTVATRDEKLGYRTLLVTGDKDAYQLATDLTQIVTTRKGISDVVIYGPAEVEERYGVKPEQFIDFLGLKGDSADNIPGVPGIGDKRAADMLQRFGNLEGIYDNLDAFKGKQLENLQNNRDMAFLSRRVATIVRDVDFDLDLESIEFPSFDPAKVAEAFKAVRFMAHMGKVLEMQAGGGAATASAELEVIEPISEGTWALDFVNEALKAGTRLAIAWRKGEQDSLFEPSLTVAACTSEGTAILTGSDAEDALARIIREGSFAAYDAKALVGLVYPRDTALEAKVTQSDVLAMRGFDVSLAAYVLNSSQGGAQLSDLVQEYAGFMLPDDDASDATKTAREAAAIAKLADELADLLEKDGSFKVFDEIDMPLVGVLAGMERVGVKVDEDHLERLHESTSAQIDQLRAEIIELAGEEFNVDSPKQLAHILFEVLGLPPKKKTKSGYSTNAQVLQELAHLHPVPQKVLSYREYAKINSTYIEALPKILRESGDKRVHSSFNEMVTTTGRLSSSNPNLQNIPVRTDFGRQIRECFVPLADGELFLSADYSQIELRLLAHLSGDKGLIEAFCSGTDFHAQTAARVFGLPVDQITPQLRSRAKAVNFGIVYGQQAFGLSQSLEIPFREAQEMIDRYFEAYPQVKEYLEQVKSDAKANGYAETLYGRKRHIPELKSSNAAQRSFGERTAMNHPMQGTAADIIKIAMRRVADALVEREMAATLMLQVHDELDFSVPASEVEELSTLVKECMEGVAELSVPLVADVAYGNNWAEAH